MTTVVRVNTHIFEMRTTIQLRLAHVMTSLLMHCRQLLIRLQNRLPKIGPLVHYRRSPNHAQPRVPLMEHRALYQVTRIPQIIRLIQTRVIHLRSVWVIRYKIHRLHQIRRLDVRTHSKMPRVRRCTHVMHRRHVPHRIIIIHARVVVIRKRGGLHGCVDGTVIAQFGHAALSHEHVMGLLRLDHGIVFQPGFKVLHLGLIVHCRGMSVEFSRLFHNFRFFLHEVRGGAGQVPEFGVHHVDVSNQFLKVVGAVLGTHHFQLEVVVGLVFLQFYESPSVSLLLHGVHLVAEAFKAGLEGLLFWDVPGGVVAGVRRLSQVFTNINH